MGCREKHIHCSTQAGGCAHILEVKDSSSLYEKVFFVVTLGLSGYLDMNLRVQQNCLVSMRHWLAGGYLKGATAHCNWIPLKKMPEGKRKKKTLWKSEGSLGSVWVSSHISKPNTHLTIVRSMSSIGCGQRAGAKAATVKEDIELASSELQRRTRRVLKNW